MVWQQVIQIGAKMTKKLVLISKEYTIDSIGQRVPKEERKEVFCDVGSVTAGEFARAGAIGFKPVYQFKVWEAEYNGQEIVEYDGQRYSVYRTYLSENHRMELYVHKDVGV